MKLTHLFTPFHIQSEKLYVKETLCYLEKVEISPIIVAGFTRLEKNKGECVPMDTDDAPAFIQHYKETLVKNDKSDNTRT